MHLEAENARLKESLVKSSEVIIKKDAKIASLEDQLYWLRKKVFGQMSEKHLPVDPAQLSLFSTEAITDEQKAAFQTEPTVLPFYNGMQPTK